MQTKRFLRYLAPNLVTLASLSFGTFSIFATIEGRFAQAAWFVIFSVLTDKLDGFVARLVKGTSEFGVQLDSFADFLNFGIAPAMLWYAFLSREHELPFHHGAGFALLTISCVVWVLAVTFRLARYNIVGDDPKCHRIFFGVPTTLMGGTLTAFFLVCLKYGAEAAPTAAAVSTFDELHLLGDFDIPSGVWQTWPILMLVGAFLMASTVKIPKLGLSRSKVLTAFIFLNVFAGYTLGFARKYPEYLCFAATVYIAVSLVWGQFNTSVRGLKPPPIFPKEDPPQGKEPVRPEEDQLPEGDSGEDESSSPLETARRTTV